MYSKIISKHIFPAWTRLKYPRLDKYYKHFEQTQWWSRENLRAYQTEKLRKLIKHAYNNVQYYRELFRHEKLTPSDIKKIDDLNKIPITKKSTMKKNYSSKEAFATNYRDFSPTVSRSSGSTGSPMALIRGQNAAVISEALMWRFYDWMKVERSDSEIMLWGRPFVSNWIQTRRKHFSRFLRGVTEFNSYGWARDDYISCLRWIKRIQPKIIRGYAAVVYILAKTAKEEGYKDIYPEAVTTTAQTLLGPQREVIEHQFNTKVFDQYGGSESLIAACECEQHYGYHVIDEHIILELVENDGLPPGVKKIVITDLDNYAQPFIRYENGDLGEPLDNWQCQCGRGLSMLKSIKGRTQDIILTEDDRYFTLEPFTGILLNINGVDHFQIIQDSKRSITMKIVKNNSFLEKDLKFIKDNLDLLLDNSLNYSIEFVGTIPISESGKNKILISKVNNL